MKPAIGPVRLMLFAVGIALSSCGDSEGAGDLDTTTFVGRVPEDMASGQIDWQVYPTPDEWTFDDPLEAPGGRVDVETDGEFSLELLKGREYTLSLIRDGGTPIMLCEERDGALVHELPADAPDEVELGALCQAPRGLFWVLVAESPPAWPWCPAPAGLECAGGNGSQRWCDCTCNCQGCVADQQGEEPAGTTCEDICPGLCEAGTGCGLYQGTFTGSCEDQGA